MTSIEEPMGARTLTLGGFHLHECTPATKILYSPRDIMMKGFKEEQSLDLISKLPNEILRQIASFIPLKEAVRTSILSTEWRRIWIPFQVESEFDSPENLSQIAAALLKSCHGPEVWNFCLGFKTEDSLIFSATKGVGKELHLNFSGGKQMKSNFNLTFSATKQNAMFCSLKTLHLRSINRMAGELVSTLFSNCHFLESLKLEKCVGLENISVQASSDLTSFAMVDCPNVASIAIFAPNLKSFSYRGSLPKIRINSCPNIVDVVLDVGEGLGENSEFECEEVVSLLSSIKDVEVLTLSGWLLEWLCAAGVIFGRLQFKFNKLKELWWLDSEMNGTKRDSLACFLNVTLLLEKLFVKIDPKLSSISCPYFDHYWHESHLCMDCDTVKSNASPLQHLKMVELAGFTNQEHELQLMDLVLKMAVTIKSMTAISPENQLWWVTKIPLSQLKHTLGCHSKRIAILSPSKDYYFGLTEENSVS